MGGWGGGGGLLEIAVVLLADNLPGRGYFDNFIHTKARVIFFLGGGGGGQNF